MTLAESVAIALFVYVICLLVRYSRLSLPGRVLPLRHPQSSFHTDGDIHAVLTPPGRRLISWPCADLVTEERKSLRSEASNSEVGYLGLN